MRWTAYAGAPAQAQLHTGCDLAGPRWRIPRALRTASLQNLNLDEVDPDSGALNPWRAIWGQDKPWFPDLRPWRCWIRALNLWKLALTIMLYLCALSANFSAAIFFPKILLGLVFSGFHQSPFELIFWPWAWPEPESSWYRRENQRKRSLDVSGRPSAGTVMAPFLVLNAHGPFRSPILYLSYIIP